MNNKNEYMCPICGEGTLCADFTDGSKWGRAYCNRCDCGGPEVRTGYDENFDAPWRADARKQFVDVVNEHVIARPQRDPETGLPPCGCGMPAVRIVNTEIMYNGKKRVKYSIKCPKNHVHTDCFETQLQADNYWHRAMGCPIK